MNLYVRVVISAPNAWLILHIHLFDEKLFKAVCTSFTVLILQ